MFINNAMPHSRRENLHGKRYGSRYPIPALDNADTIDLKQVGINLNKF